MAMTHHLADSVLEEHLYTGGATPATPHLWLHKGDPGEAGTANVAQTDVPGNIVRKPIAFANANAPSNTTHTTPHRSVFNTGEGTWSGAEIDSGETITHFTIWTASDGDLMFSAEVDTSKTTGSDGVTIAIGELEVALEVAVAKS